MEAENLALPGARVSLLRAQVEALDASTPKATVTAKFETDFISANRIWHFGPAGVLSGNADPSILNPDSHRKPEVPATTTQAH